MHHLTFVIAQRIIRDLHAFSGEVDLFVYYHAGISQAEMLALQELNENGVIDIYSDDGQEVWLALSNRWKEQTWKTMTN